MADPALEQVAKWRAAHQDIAITEAALLTMAPFASLYANDFLVYAEQKGLDKDAIEFFRSLHREMVWVYDMLAQAQRDADGPRLFKDIINAARSAGGPDSKFYDTISRFLRDYAKANNIEIDTRLLTSWEATFAGLAEVAEPVPVEGVMADAKP